MAPSTALLFIGLGSSLLGNAVRPKVNLIRLLTGIVALLTCARAILVLSASAIFDVARGLFLGATHPGNFPAALFGQMSPITAFGFLLGGAALLLSAAGRRHRPMTIALEVCAVGDFFLGLVCLIGYLHGTPILYGGNQVPIALPTAVLFIFVGLAFVTQPRSGSLIFGLFCGPSTRSRLIRAFVPGVAVLTLVTSTFDVEFALKLGIENPAVVAGLHTVIGILVSTMLIMLLAPRVGRDIDAVQASLALQARRAAALLELPQAAETLDEAAFIQCGLEMAEDLTDSPISFIHFVNEDEQSIELITWSRRTLAVYCHALFDRHYPVHQAGIWADALRRRQQVVFNDYAGYQHKRGLPEGHAALHRLISLPVIENGKVVMLAGVGNKASDYNDEDVNTVQLFANLIWRVVRYQRSRKTIERERLRLQTILKTSSDGIHILDSEGTLVEANDAFLKMLGLDQSAIGRLHISVWNTQDSWETLKARFDALINHQGTLVLETRHRRRDGVALDVEVSTRAIKIEGKDYIYAASRDISDRKHTEEQLRVAATAMESQEGTVISDAAGIILRVNQAFAEITGYSVDEAVGKSTSLLRSGRHDNAFYAALWHSINSTGTWKGEIWNRRKNGEIYPEWLTITAVKAADGTVTHYVGTFSDITKRKEAEDQINELAFYDPLTHLPNRRLLVDRLSQALAASIRNEREGALLFVDLDNFKKVNDTHGHDQGDLLLREVARRLTTSFRGVDTVARIGGDEFVVVLADLSGDPEEAAAQAESVGQKILAILGQPYQITGNVFRSTPSIGITLFGEQRGNIDELMKQADIAMYQAKAAGRNALRFFDPELQETMKARASLEADLHHGIQEGEILLHYQPQVDGVGRLMGAEALVRWRHPERGLVSPAEFIPLAEETGLILAIGDYVLETGCRQLVAWANRAETAHITLSVNVSARQFRQPNFVDQVLGVVNRTGVNPRRLKLELTESMLVEDIPEIIAKMMALKSRGISFSLDDFGTGYSSLAYLKRLPLDQLKIDQSFVRDVLSDPNDAAIAKTIVSLAQSLGLDCIAEGVETAEQREFLADSGCHAYQGYFFSRPLPLEAFDAYAMQT